MNTMIRWGGALGAAALVSSATVARADDTSTHAGHHGSSTQSTQVENKTKSSTTTTTGAEYDERAGAERGTGDITRPNRTLIITGGAVLAGSYLTSAIVGVANDRDADNRLLIPVVGPWADLADRQCDQSPCDHKFWSTTLLVASGVLQAGGLATLITSFFVPESDTPGLLRNASTKKPEQASVHLVPLSMGARSAGAGFGAVGTF